MDGYLIVVEGRIGAHRHLKLVLDTGSTHSVLRSDFAGSQTFVRQPVRIVNLEQVLKQELVEVPDFELGPLRITLLPMLMHDLDYLRKTVPGVDGVVGLDVLRSTSFTLTFATGELLSDPLQHCETVQTWNATMLIWRSTSSY